MNTTKSTPAPAKIEAIHLPTHDEIAQCARELWTESGKPTDRDDAIWFEAERRLVEARRTPAKRTATSTPAPTRSRAVHGRA